MSYTGIKQAARGYQVQREGKKLPPVTTILLVDDDSDHLFLYKTFLENNGYKVIVESRPELALKLLEHTSVDIVVCDRCMPGLDGFKLRKKAKAAGALAAFVLLSVHSDEMANSEDIAIFDGVCSKLQAVDQLLPMLSCLSE